MNQTNLFRLQWAESLDNGRLTDSLGVKEKGWDVSAPLAKSFNSTFPPIVVLG